MTNLKIIQLNTKSILSNLEILTKYIEDEEIDIALLSETWLKTKTKIKNFNSFIRNRADGYGGVAILVKKNFKAKRIQVVNFSPMEVIEVEIEINKLKFYFVSVYIPPGISNSILKTKIQTFFIKYENKPNTIIGGDFNGHNSLWEDDHEEDCRGNLLAEIITQGDCKILNDGTHTYFNSHSHTSSAIDLSLISSIFNNRIVCRCEHINLGSDHYPIIMEINMPGLSKKVSKMMKIKYHNIAKTIQEWNIDNFLDLEDYEKELLNTVKQNTIIYTQNKHTSKPWWNKKLNRQT